MAGAPKYKLTYFNFTGRAEPSRLLFAAADRAFVDERITQEQWQTKKAETPQGSLPLLDINGKAVLCQSQAIFRYLAREFGLAGKTNMESAQIDIFCETVRDLGDAGFGVFFEKDEAIKAEKKAKFEGETAPAILGRLEKLISKDNFACGSSLSAADLLLFSTLELLKLTDLSKFPKLAANRQKVSSLPRIAKYLKNRPSS